KPESILEVFCKESATEGVKRLLDQAGVQVRISRAAEKTNIIQPPVQARIKLDTIEFHELEKRINTGRERDLIVALDHITDPRNLGAIVRSAAFFGVREVVAPERRQVLL